jgi:hypothetical protein
MAHQSWHQADTYLPRLAPLSVAKQRLPGSAWENGYNERFNGTLRREVLRYYRARAPSLRSAVSLRLNRLWNHGAFEPYKSVSGHCHGSTFSPLSLCADAFFEEDLYGGRGGRLSALLPAALTGDEWGAHLSALSLGRSLHHCNSTQVQVQGLPSSVQRQLRHHLRFPQAGFRRSVGCHLAHCQFGQGHVCAATRTDDRCLIQDCIRVGSQTA